MSDKGGWMKNEYLWDGSGEADAEVVRLERAVGKFRHAGRAPELPKILAAPGRESATDLRGARHWFQFAAVAASAMVTLSIWMGLRVHSESLATGSDWGVEQVAGAPRVGMKTIGGVHEKGTLRIGQTLETDQQ